jgi:hypothetical protein
VGVPLLVSETELDMFGSTHPNMFGLTQLVVRFDPPVSILCLLSCLLGLSPSYYHKDRARQKCLNVLHRLIRYGCSLADPQGLERWREAPRT